MYQITITSHYAINQFTAYWKPNEGVKITNSSIPE